MRGAVLSAHPFEDFGRLWVRAWGIHYRRLDRSNAHGEYHMIAFDDKRWDGIKGGYKMPYDPRPVLRQLEAGSEAKAVWAELWEELHHPDQRTVRVLNSAHFP